MTIVEEFIAQYIGSRKANNIYWIRDCKLKQLMSLKYYRYIGKMSDTVNIYKTQCPAYIAMSTHYLSPYYNIKYRKEYY